MIKKIYTLKSEYRTKLEELGILEDFLYELNTQNSLVEKNIILANHQKSLSTLIEKAFVWKFVKNTDINWFTIYCDLKYD